MAGLDGSLGGGYVPSTNYNRTGATDTGGTYDDATVTDATLSGTTTIGTGATLTTPKVAQINDTSSVNRAIFNATAKTITDASATALFEIPLASLGVAAGFMVFAVVARDATDQQVISGIATYAGENKGGTLVGNLTYDTANESKAVSTGTLTLSFTDDDNSDAVRFLVQPTGSLTETGYTITYTLFPLVGTVTIL